jgi:hypothetical protein
MITPLAVAAVVAVSTSPVSPGSRYDPDIPTVAQITGHAVGSHISTPAEIAAYVEALARAAPDRTELVTYATSEEGRPLHLLAIGSAERMARLGEIKAGLARLADPRGLPDGEAEELVRDLPAVVWLYHGVHGDEISSPEAALALAHHLLAAEDDEQVDLIRREAIVLIDPLQNPDGRARFIATNALGQGPSPDPEPAAAEHVQPWPGGRANHYLFDMNRDWFAQTQPETRGRLEVFLEWYPQVAIDLHEMGGNATYFFAPPAEPLNPHVVESQARWHERIGRAIAARFDERGVAYFVGEVFDSFYPGYGETWPMLHGAVGSTYEQASARGLVFRRIDGTELTYLDGIRNHFTAALTTAAAAARGRETLLREFLEFRRSAVREGQSGELRQYVLVPGQDPARVRRLAELLLAQGIEVRLAEEELVAGGRRFPAGSYVVSLAQPSGRLVRNLLDPRVPMPDEYIQEQERRHEKRLPDEIYDVTAWSLPLVFDVECVGSGTVSGRTRAWTPEAEPGPAASGPLEEAKVAWLLPWGVGTAKAVVEALEAGIRLRVAEGEATLGGRTFPAGTAIVRRAENADDVRATLGPIVSRHHAEAVAIDSGYPQSGVSLGSFKVRPLSSPRVLLAWDTPTSSLSAGWARWVLERRYGQRVSVVRVSTLRRVELERFDVIVLPSGRYADEVGEKLVERLRAWIREGGTLVALAEAARWLTTEDVGLLATSTELRGGCPEKAPPDAEDEDDEDDEEPSSGTCDVKTDEPYDLESAIRPERERPGAIPGALLRVQLDPEHWLSAGSDGEIQVIVDGRRVFSPLKLDKGRNVGVFASKEDVVASGLVWDEAREQLARKAFLMHQPLGRGQVIAFAEDPNYRGYAEATELLFMNAVLLGPAHRERDLYEGAPRGGLVRRGEGP